MNSQRRTFRGRGGPTDRRLPKHDARRRRNTAKSNNGEAVQDGDCIVNCCADAPSSSSASDAGNDGQVGTGTGTGNAKADTADEDGAVFTETADSSGSSINGERTGFEQHVQRTQPNRKLDEEVRHLLVRIANVRTSMRLSAQALTADADTYKHNVLNAVVNCHNEYRHILRYHAEDLSEMAADDRRSAIVASMSVPMFELIQHSLQCGPLAGSKPGYFKRCGSETAQLAHDYLFDLLSVDGESFFSEKQDRALQTWQQNAHKAATDRGKPLSKSMKKKQQRAVMVQKEKIRNKERKKSRNASRKIE